MRQRAGSPRTVRLWWRCSLCRYRLDTFGFDHDDRSGMAMEVLPHLEGRHGIRPSTYTEAAGFFTADGKTSRVARASVIQDNR